MIPKEDWLILFRSRLSRAQNYDPPIAKELGQIGIYFICKIDDENSDSFKTCEIKHLLSPEEKEYLGLKKYTIAMLVRKIADDENILKEDIIFY
ncbi:MAG: hypothetical protein KGO96_06915 [Elusimicrobia bacterium]|nr:hypothetical protein [Elusimicrobiota bacterium]